MMEIPGGWTVLLLGGASGAGKSTAAAEIGRRFGVSWLQVDDLRLALQHSHVTLPHGTEALYFFERTPDVWRLPPTHLRDALIAVGRVIEPAIEIVVASHVDTHVPVVIEGDGILPSLLDRPLVRSRVAEGAVRAVFVSEADAAVLLASMTARGRGIAERDAAGLETEAQAKWLFDRWITNEARWRRLPVVAARPHPALAERVVAAISRRSLVGDFPPAEKEKRRD